MNLSRRRIGRRRLLNQRPCCIQPRADVLDHAITADHDGRAGLRGEFPCTPRAARCMACGDRRRFASRAVGSGIDHFGAGEFRQHIEHRAAADLVSTCLRSMHIPRCNRDLRKDDVQSSSARKSSAIEPSPRNSLPQKSHPSATAASPPRCRRWTRKSRRPRTDSC